MIAGLVGTGPTLNIPVPDSKVRNLEKPGNGKFSDVLDSKIDSKMDRPPREEIAKTEVPDKAQLSPEKSEKGSRVKSQDDSEKQTENPPDPEVMDPRTSALKAQRDRAIRKFMDSFEGEFGIPPEDMVEAMSQLTAQDLDKPPEKTVDHIIAQLNLAKKDEPQAKNMYLGLLLQLRQIDSKVALPLPQGDLLSQMSAQRIQLSSDKKEVMSGQVQNLSDKFWMRGAQEAKAAAPEMNQMQVREFLKKMITAESRTAESRTAESVDMDADIPKTEIASTTESIMKQLELEVPESSEELEIAQTEEVSFTPDTMAMKSMVRQPAAQNRDMTGQNQQQQGQENQISLPQAKETVSLEAIQSELKRLGIKPIEHVETKKLAKAEDALNANLDVSMLSQPRVDSSNAFLPVIDVQPKVEMSPVQKTENIQQIMNQAQILLKNGGGEVKVEMSPEGMGSIQMRLQVTDGKVQVHMSTETKEAKNLIETSMKDLKQSLAAHQLSVDLVKVDVVNQTVSSQNAQNDMQNQMQNYLNQQQRDGTKQFWQQFNENFGNRQARENFIDAQNIRSPAKSQTLPGFDRVSTNGRARSDGRGKSLNLVA